MPLSQFTARAPLKQPQPIAALGTSTIAQAEPSAPVVPAQPPVEVPRRQSSIVPEPPIDLVEMSLTPDQFPKSSFVDVVMEEQPLVTATPPRPDTPPPPPPAISTLHHQNPHSFGVVSPPSQMLLQNVSPWEPVAPKDPAFPGSSAPTSTPRPVHAAGNRAELPVFTANGVIPFAPNHSAAVPSAQQEQGREVVNGSGMGEVVAKGKGKDLWEVPDTPAR